MVNEVPGCVLFVLWWVEHLIKVVLVVAIVVSFCLCVLVCVCTLLYVSRCQHLCGYLFAYRGDQRTLGILP